MSVLYFTQLEECTKSAPNTDHGAGHDDTNSHKLQALVYDILPSTTAVFSYAISPFLIGRMFLPSWKYSAKLVDS